MIRNHHIQMEHHSTNPLRGMRCKMDTGSLLVDCKVSTDPLPVDEYNQRSEIGQLSPAAPMASADKVNFIRVSAPFPEFPLSSLHSWSVH